MLLSQEYIFSLKEEEGKEIDIIKLKEKSLNSSLPYKIEITYVLRVIDITAPVKTVKSFFKNLGDCFSDLMKVLNEKKWNVSVELLKHLDRNESKEREYTIAETHNFIVLSFSPGLYSNILYSSVGFRFYENALEHAVAMKKIDENSFSLLVYNGTYRDLDKATDPLLISLKKTLTATGYYNRVCNWTAIQEYNKRVSSFFIL